MKFTIKHEIRGRIRIHNCQRTMSTDQADELQYYLITKVKCIDYKKTM